MVAGSSPVAVTETFLVIKTYNVHTKTKGREFEKFEDFCSIFNLPNLIKTDICFKKNSKSTIDLFAANKSNCFQQTHATETGLRDFHKMIRTLFTAKIT